ncbi:MAG: tRNA threonylcarbamoyladenosine dehydratase [Kiritimatiellae bacterium]|nr:tRNA threonylcarbamoyladenosine dehydratase [Kiritimatiellia bacterium]
MAHPAIFRRAELMLGTPTLDRLKATRVAIFGLGGVGSWCAESLVRSGVGKLLLVDSDRVCITNVNRQLMATTKTAGQVKVQVLAERLREINPLVELDVRQQIYNAETASSFGLENYDYVIDAIDSLTEKATLVRHALSIPSVTLFASMGAALKMDPFQIRSSEFRKIEGDGLARALRTKFKKTGGMPERRFTCVWSPERRENLGPAGAACGLGQCVCPKDEGVGEASLATHEWCSTKARINGTVAHTTAIFGFALAGLVVADVERKAAAQVETPAPGA